jgi:hypothetical protein
MENNEIVLSYHESGLSRREWCSREGISLGRLKYWLGKERANTRQEPE